MQLCHPRFTITQHALLSCLPGTGRVLISPLAGWVAQQYGWIDYFILGTLLPLTRPEKHVNNARANSDTHTMSDNESPSASRSQKKTQHVITETLNTLNRQFDRLISKFLQQQEKLARSLQEIRSIKTPNILPLQARNSEPFRMPF